jgi:tetratricopeptide (TPR) repeat protein
MLAVMTLCASIAWGVTALAAEGENTDFLKDYGEGQFAMQVQKWDRAVTHLSEAVKKNPKFYPALYERAIAYSKLGQYDKSIEDLKQVIHMNPELPDVYALLGLVYEIKKDYAAALKVYQAALPRVKKPAVKRGLEGWISQMEEKLKESEKKK